MDILITNGDIGITGCGGYLFTKGIDEVLHKVMLCAKIKKGSFIYNKALGTDLHSVDCKSSVSKKTAEMLLSEALIGAPGYAVEVENIEKTDTGSMKLVIMVKREDETRRAQVTVNADL